MEPLPMEKVTGTGDREIKMIQVARDENKALYERFIGGNQVGFEMFKIRKQEASTQERAGVAFEVKAKELFTNDEGFGKNAWALPYHTKEQAIEAFNELDVVTPKQRGKKKRD